MFEEFRRGRADEVARELAAVEPRGEYTLVIAPPAGGDVVTEPVVDANIERFVRALLADGVTTKTLAHALAQLPGITRQEAYARGARDRGETMTLTRVVGKGRTVTMSADELAALGASSARTVVDVGTGDAHDPYKLAVAHPDWLVIGIDPLDAPLGEIADKSTRKPAKGGVANLVLLRASIESLPSEVRGLADEVSVLLPWGKLLEGIVLAHDDVLRGIVELLRPRGRLVVTLNGEIWAESMPARFEHLPVPTPEHVAEVVAPGFARGASSSGPRACSRPRRRTRSKRRGRASSVTGAPARASCISKAKSAPESLRRSIVVAPGGTREGGHDGYCR